MHDCALAQNFSQLVSHSVFPCRVPRPGVGPTTHGDRGLSGAAQKSASSDGLTELRPEYRSARRRRRWQRQLNGRAVRVYAGAAAATEGSDQRPGSPSETAHLRLRSAAPRGCNLRHRPPEGRIMTPDF